MNLAGDGESSGRRDVLRASLWTMSGTVAARVLGVASALALSLLLGAFGYGQYSLLLSTTTLCAGVGQMGLQSVMTRELARHGPDERASMASTSLALMTSITTVVSLGVVGLSYRVPFLHPLAEAAGSLVWLIAPWSVLVVVNNQSAANLIGILRFGQSALVSASRGVLVAVGIVGASLAGDVSKVVPAAVIAELAAALIALAFLVKNGLLFSTIDGRYVRTMVRVGAGAGLASLLIQSVTWGTQTFLANQPDGFEQVGVFALGMRLGLVASVLSNSFVTALLPFLSAGNGRVNARKGVLLPISIAAVSSCVTALVLPLVSRYWPSEYFDHINVLMLMLLVAVASAANTSVGSLAVARGKFRYWILSDLILSAVMAACVVGLVPAYGALGLAISQLAAYSLSVLFLAVMIRRRSDVR